MPCARVHDNEAYLCASEKNVTLHNLFRCFLPCRFVFFVEIHGAQLLRTDKSVVQHESHVHIARVLVIERQTAFLALLTILLLDSLGPEIWINWRFAQKKVLNQNPDHLK